MAYLKNQKNMVSLINPGISYKVYNYGISNCLLCQISNTIVVQATDAIIMCDCEICKINIYIETGMKVCIFLVNRSRAGFLVASASLKLTSSYVCTQVNTNDP